VDNLIIAKNIAYLEFFYAYMKSSRVTKNG